MDNSDKRDSSAEPDEGPGAGETARAKGGKFAKGVSGNPTGKRKGARHKTSLAIEALLEGEHEALTRAAIEKAKAGDTVAIRLCLDRIAPPRKDAPVNFDLPPIASAEDTVKASAATLAAVSAGDISIDEGARVMGLLLSHKQIVELGDHEKRLAALEGKEA